MVDIELTPEEQYKYDVISKVINLEIKPGAAAKLLAVSTRQIRRLRAAVIDGSSQAVVHGLKGKSGNRRIKNTIKQKVIGIIRQNYYDFKPSFTTEKLEEKHAISISRETTRLWMSEAGIWKPRKQKQTAYHSWRPRKDYYGELIQFDGSYHHWFENRHHDEDGNSTEVCLLATIDDATGKITKAKFSANEGVVAVFKFWKEYILVHGKPLAIYLDRFSTYKINHKAAIDNQELMTQFQRATKELGIELITAYSPEAKGRVEKLFGTLQDRLVKEMRLENINAPEDGNKFLEEIFIPKFNKKFSVIPTKEGNVHRPLSETDRKKLNKIFSIQSERVIKNDFTIQFENNWYQLTELQLTTVRAGDRILVEEWLDGTIHFSLREKYLNYTILPEKQKKLNQPPLILTTHRLNWKPPLNHPWRKGFRQRY